MGRKIVLSFVGVLAALFYLSSVAIAAGPDTDPRCEGLTGAAFGLCQAATAVGCDDEATRTPGCAEIEDSYTQITGNTPPWLCPCSETYQSAVDSWTPIPVQSDCFLIYSGDDIVAAGAGDVSWTVGPWLMTGTNSVWGNYCTVQSPLGFDYGRNTNISNVQLQSCIQQIIEISPSWLNLTCHAYP